MNDSPTGLNWGGFTGLFGWGSADNANQYMQSRNGNLLPGVVSAAQSVVAGAKPVPQPNTDHTGGVFHMPQSGQHPVAPPVANHDPSKAVNTGPQRANQLFKGR